MFMYMYTEAVLVMIGSVMFQYVWYFIVYHAQVAMTTPNVESPEVWR